MIVGLEGVIEKKEPTVLHLNVSGVVYEVFISLQCSAMIVDNNVKLVITHIIREDAQTLYGFLDSNEKKLFDTVIKVNGVGPKVGLAICSTFTPEQFFDIITQHDINTLKQVPGIGPKGARRILVELNGFSLDGFAQTDESKTNYQLEAKLALESLGFKKELITKVLKQCSSTDTNTLIKEALKKLQK